MSTFALFEQKQVRRAWNQAEAKWFFSIDDVVEVLTGSTNVKDYIKKLRKRDAELNAYWGTNCPLVGMPGADLLPLHGRHDEILGHYLKSMEQLKNS